MLYIISDTHLHHPDIIIESNRPINSDALIIRSLRKLTAKDTLLHLGDICGHDSEEVHATIIQPLRCRKVLVMGNHDHKKREWYLQHGWDMVQKYLLFTFKRYTILACHYPIHVPDHADFVLHGHVHGFQRHMKTWGKSITENHITMACEIYGYKPLPLATLISYHLKAYKPA